MKSAFFRLTFSASFCIINLIFHLDKIRTSGSLAVT